MILRRRSEFKATLAGGLEAEWENKEVQALATAHYNEMDQMGNANGQLEVSSRPDSPLCASQPSPTRARRS